MGIDEDDARCRHNPSMANWSCRQELSATKHRLENDLLLQELQGARRGLHAAPRSNVWPVEMTELEREAYDAVTGYCRTDIIGAASKATRNNALGFLMASVPEAELQLVLRRASVAPPPHREA